jgi:hypothetical protein
MPKISLQRVLLILCLIALVLTWACPVIAATPTPVPYEDRPVERNPYLVSGGVLIFAVIAFALLRYSRPRAPKE